MQWHENSLVSGHDIYTVLPDGILEIRGPGWEGIKRKGDTPNTDRPRRCKFASVEEAKHMAELVAKLTLEKDVPANVQKVS